MSGEHINLRCDLPPLPHRMKSLPVDGRGFPVPWFVAWIEGEPKFQVADTNKWALAANHSRCWLCGKPMGVHKAFVIGPMCGINRVSSEPPCHRECAEFAARACPFLTRPTAQRSERGLKDIKIKKPGGVMIERNPGVTLLWITKSFRIVRTPTGRIINVGEPTEVHFYREGRKATRAEVEDSVNTGLPILEEIARKDGPQALIQFDRQLERFGQIVAEVA